MTTLVALATKDAVILGCDSLGTISAPLIKPLELLKFFDPAKNFELKLDVDGKPLLKSFNEIYNLSQSMPSQHMTHITKLFSLAPLKAGVMLTGIASIGVRTIKSLIEEFRKDKITSLETQDYSFRDISEKLMEHLVEFYEREFTEEAKRPYLELILGGYGKKAALPEVHRIILPKKEIFVQWKEGDFGIAFGGQMKEIQRIVFGTDYGNRLRLSKRHIDLIRKYRDKNNQFLKTQNVTTEIPELTTDEMVALDIFADNWELEGFHSDWGDFSEQNAIECVDFFVNIMIKSQQFSSSLPTVGGEVHIALINKDKFRFVSKEEYYHAGHNVPKHELR